MMWVALAEYAWKGTAILAAAFVAAALMRRSAASLRHLVWTAAFAALLILPTATRFVPNWSPAVGAHSSAIEAAQSPAPITVSSVTAPGPQPRTWNWLVPGFWLLGCAATAAWFLLGAMRTSWIARRSIEAAYAHEALVRRARALGIGQPVRVLESAGAPMPLAWGVLRPVVILPSGASAWPAPRLDAVLLHELLHIRRLDPVAQAVAQAACSIYWFHPAAWFGLRQLRKERERACDDAVLLRGIAAHDYATHLMEVARAMTARRRAWAAAPAMAQRSDLESRVRALLEHRRNRGPVSRRAAVAIGAAACAVLLSIAAISAHAQARGALAGLAEDSSGARIPHCQIVATNLDGSNQEITHTNAAGEYSFRSIPPGRYTLEFRGRGFAVRRQNATVAPGAVTRADAALEIGSVVEAVVVKGQKPVAGAAPAVGTPQRIRVGGNVQATRLISMAKPVYPEDLQRAGVQGTVVMRAVISTAGDLLNLEVVNTDVNPELAKAAVDAVRQWRYQPTLLNGQPVEVTTTISVDFTLE